MYRLAGDHRIGYMEDLTDVLCRGPSKLGWTLPKGRQGYCVEGGTTEASLAASSKSPPGFLLSLATSVWFLGRHRVPITAPDAIGTPSAELSLGPVASPQSPPPFHPASEPYRETVYPGKINWPGLSLPSVARAMPQKSNQHPLPWQRLDGSKRARASLPHRSPEPCLRKSNQHALPSPHPSHGDIGAVFSSVVVRLRYNWWRSNLAPRPPTWYNANASLRITPITAGLPSPRRAAF